MTYNFALLLGRDGIMEIREEKSLPSSSLVSIPSISAFVEDYERLTEIASDGAMRSFCFQRLQMLSHAFKMVNSFFLNVINFCNVFDSFEYIIMSQHITTNRSVENEAQESLLGTDFYRTMKVTLR